MWIGFVCLYGVLKGVRDIIKKKAMEKNSAMEVLFFIHVYKLLFVYEREKRALSISDGNDKIGYTIAWICSFKAIKKLPIGFYGIMDMSRVIFATVLEYSVVMTRLQVWHLCLLQPLVLNAKGKGVGEEKTKPIYIVLESYIMSLQTLFRNCLIKCLCRV